MFAKNCLPLLYTMRQYPTRNQPYLRAYYQTKKATIWSKIWHLCRPHSARSSMGWCSETGTPMVLECTMDIHKFLPDRAILASKWAYRYQEEYCLSVSLINRRPLGGWNDLPCSENSHSFVSGDLASPTNDNNCYNFICQQNLSYNGKTLQCWNNTICELEIKEYEF